MDKIILQLLRLVPCYVQLLQLQSFVVPSCTALLVSFGFQASARRRIATVCCDCTRILECDASTAESSPRNKEKYFNGVNKIKPNFHMTRFKAGQSPSRNSVKCV